MTDSLNTNETNIHVSEEKALKHASNKNPLVWIDCEMTGLNIEVDELIEVAVIITDSDLNILDPGISVVINPGEKALHNMNDFVTEMHTNSGLINELSTGIKIRDAEKVILDYVKKFVPEPKKALLSGNSIATDKMFLVKQMPELIDYLHYRIVDVSTIKELAKRWFPRVYYHIPLKEGNHRALADIRESITELCYYRETIFPSGRGPSSEECVKISSKFS